MAEYVPRAPWPAQVKWGGMNAARTGASASRDLVFVVLVRLVHGKPSEFIGHFQQVLVALVPLRAHFAQEHRTLVRPTQLQISNFAHVGTQPARILYIVAVSELRVGQAL